MSHWENIFKPAFQFMILPIAFGVAFGCDVFSLVQSDGVFHEFFLILLVNSIKGSEISSKDKSMF